MKKLINKYQIGGWFPIGYDNNIYRPTYGTTLPEAKVTAERPSWLRDLTDYDLARLRSGQISSETAKSIAQKRATGTSQFMKDVNRLALIPNAAVGSIAAIPALATTAAGLYTAGAAVAPHVVLYFPKFMDFTMHPISNIIRNPGVSSLVRAGESSGLAIGGGLGVKDAILKGINKEVPWYDAAAEGVLSGLMTLEGLPALKALPSAVKDNVKFVKNIPKDIKRYYNTYLKKRNNDDRTIFERISGKPYNSYVVFRGIAPNLREKARIELYPYYQEMILAKKGFDYSIPELKYKSTTDVNNISETPLTLHFPNKDVSGTTTNLITGKHYKLEEPSRRNEVIGRDAGDLILMEYDTGDIVPLRNSDNLNNALAEHIKEIEEKTGYPVVGSSKLISKGYIGGTPGDIEILVDKTGVDRVKDLLKFTFLRETAGNTGITGSSPLVYRGSEANNLDINILDNTGTLIHQLESTRTPGRLVDFYSETAKRLQNKYTPSLTSSIPINKNIQEYLKDKDMIFLNIIDNNMKSPKSKHIIRLMILMNNSDPEAIKHMSTAIDNMYALIRGFERVSSKLKHDWNNPEANKEILRLINNSHTDKIINIDEVSKNPEQVKNFVDRWYMRNAEHTRSINYDPNESLSYEESLYPLSLLGGGSSEGGGGNTTSGGSFGGFTRAHTSYTYVEPRIVHENKEITFNDLFNYFKNEEEIWKDPEKIKNAINKATESLKLPSISIRPYNNFTDDIFFAARNGKITPSDANNLIEEIANNLGVDGIRGIHLYSTGSEKSAGRYFGNLLKYDNPRVHTSYRNIDNNHNVGEFPAEFGGDYEIINNKSNEIIPNSRKYISLKDFAKKYPKLIKDLNSYRTHSDEELFNELTEVLKQDRKGGYHRISTYEKEFLNRYAKSLGKNSIEDLDFVFKYNNDGYYYSEGDPFSEAYFNLIDKKYKTNNLEYKAAYKKYQDAKQLENERQIKLDRANDLKRKAIKSAYTREKVLNLGTLGLSSAGLIGGLIAIGDKVIDKRVYDNDFKMLPDQIKKNISFDKFKELYNGNITFEKWFDSLPEKAKNITLKQYKELKYFYSELDTIPQEHLKYIDNKTR